MKHTQKIGFIGQGWVGKNYADNFEDRGFDIVRYSKEPKYIKNKKAIKSCDIVFVAVPTPTTPNGFDGSILRETLSLIGEDKIVVIKSTIPPGTTSKLQLEYPKLIIMYSPEFLSEGPTIKKEVSFPFVSIVGISKNTKVHKKAGKQILSILPKSPISFVCNSTEAEIFKYTHNASGYLQVVFFNLMYDLTQSFGCDWSVIHKAIVADPYITTEYTYPIRKDGRGAGGHCFIKDFEMLKNVYKEVLPKDKLGLAVFQANINKNLKLLISTGRYLDLVSEVYGKKIMKKYNRKT